MNKSMDVLRVIGNMITNLLLELTNNRYFRNIMNSLTQMPIVYIL